MRKKISILLCLLMAVLCFSGCAATDETVEYDEESIKSVTEFLISYCASADEAMIQQVNKMSEFEMEYSFMQMGLRMEPESFREAMRSWEAGIDECGDYISHGEYQFEASKDELQVTVPVEYAERNAEILFVFDDQLYLESMNINASYNITELLEKAGLNTVLGMGTVFAVLLFISAIISLFRFVPMIENAFKRRKDPQESQEETGAGGAAAESSEALEDLELIAVITAAIAAAEGASSDGFIVRSIRRRPSNKWNA